MRRISSDGELDAADSDSELDSGSDVDTDFEMSSEFEEPSSYIPSLRPSLLPHLSPLPLQPQILSVNMNADTAAETNVEAP